MELGNVIYLENFRRRRGSSSALELTAVTSRDTKGLSQRLCRELANANAQGRVPLESIAGRIGMPKEDAIVAATYAHVRGWVIYAEGCAELTSDGRAAAGASSDQRSA